MTTFKETINAIRGDLPKGKFFLKVFVYNYFFSARFRVLLNYRLGKYFFKSHFFIFKQIGLYYKYKLISKRNCDFSYNAIIGKNLKLPHPIGIVIGDGVIIHDNVKIFQQVTFGSHGKKGETNSYPTIQEGAIIYAGAKIIGNIVIGKNAIIGANSVVNVNVPNDEVAVGIPCKIIKRSWENLL